VVRLDIEAKEAVLQAAIGHLIRHPQLEILCRLLFTINLSLVQLF
jgi:hypothetical protein